MAGGWGLFVTRRHTSRSEKLACQIPSLSSVGRFGNGLWLPMSTTDICVRIVITHELMMFLLPPLLFVLAFSYCDITTISVFGWYCA